MNRVLAFERAYAWLSIDDHMIHFTVSRTVGVLRSSFDKISCLRIDTFKRYAYVTPHILTARLAQYAHELECINQKLRALHRSRADPLNMCGQAKK